MPKLLLAENVEATVDQAGALPRPLFTISDNLVRTNTPADPAARETHLLDTVGSGDWWGTEPLDDLRFSPADGHLVSAALRMPEKAAASGATWLEYRRGASSAGGLVLLNPAHFRLPSAQARHYDADGQTLLGIYQDRPPAHDVRHLIIAPDLRLLFDGETLAGWALASAPRHLATWTDETPGPDVPDDALAEALAEYLDLIEERNLDDLYDGADWLAQRLTAIAQRLDTPPPTNPTGRKALRARIDELQSDWFADA